MAKPGFIYFATHGDKSIKVGRFAAHLTCSAKERQYRTLDRHFKVRHAYYSDDVNTEEQRVLSVLRLVAGTEYKGAGKEVFTGISLKRAISLAAEKTPAQLEEMARRSILALVAEPESGLTVKALLAEYNKKYPDVNEIDHPIAKRLMVIMDVLRKFGIQVVIADAEDGLDVPAYGKVISPTTLLKAAPSLKPLQSVVDELTF